jgi:transposase InsO family protein
MTQVARNLTDAMDGFLNGKEYILMDRDGSFSPTFQELLGSSGTEPVLLPPRSPNLNAHIERFHLSIKSECLDKMIFFGEASLRRAVGEYLSHYHGERNHQGPDNRLIAASDGIGRSIGAIECRERLGGLLRYYHRKAA